MNTYNIEITEGRPEDAEAVIEFTNFLSSMTKRMKHRSRLAISVLKSEWNKGVGSAVMERLIAFAGEIGSEIIELEVRSDNKRAIHLYEKYGFKRIGTSPAFFRIGDEYIDFELMYLDLREKK